MTREEYLKIVDEKRSQIKSLEAELQSMRRSFIEEHKQIKGNLPVKIHLVYQEKSIFGETLKKEADAYVVGYDVIVRSYVSPFDKAYNAVDDFYGKVFPVLREAKKNGEMGAHRFHFQKIGTIRFWEIGKEDTIYEINFGE